MLQTDSLLVEFSQMFPTLFLCKLLGFFLIAFFAIYIWMDFMLLTTFKVFEIQLGLKTRNSFIRESPVEAEYVSKI